jgi:four helix bundle protein
MDSDFRNLVVWQRAMDLADEVYDAAALLPKDERCVLSAQMRDAALSIPSNIAEGKGRWSVREYRQFVRHARGSTLELESHILFAERRKFLPPEYIQRLLARSEEVVTKINALLSYLNRRARRPSDPRPATRDPLTPRA